MTPTARTLVTALVMAALVVGASAGCYRHTINAGKGSATGKIVYDHWEHFWIVGLVGHKTLNMVQICPSGNATLEAERTFLNGLVSALTMGIYTPTKLTLRCEDGTIASIPLDSDDVRRIVNDERFTGWVAAAAPELSTAVDAAHALTFTH